MITPRTDEEARLDAVLAQLAVLTPDEIAETLREHEIKGLRMSPCDCPIARLLRKLTGDRYTVYLGLGILGQGRVLAEAETPESVQAFIQAFDGPRNPYPDLLVES